MVKKVLPLLVLLVLVLAGGAASAQTTIAVGQTRSGTLSASSGRSGGCPECFADLYRFSINSPQTLLMSMNSEAFDTYLVVLDTNGNVVVEDDDSGAGANAQIYQTFAAGTYLIEASSLEPGLGGPYSLILETAAPPEVKPINVGQTVTGALTTSSGRSVGCAGCFTDLYRFSITAERNLEIALRSEEFDAFLRVLDVNGETVSNNDDENDNSTDSRIAGNLSPGTYSIEATTYEPGAVGAYTLSLLELAPPVATPIDIGQALNRNLTSSSGRSVGCSGCFADLYEFTVTGAESLIITMSSAEFDTYLRVLDAGGNAVITDDDGGGGTDSRILQSFGPGTYQVEASSYDAGESGEYEIEVRSADVQVIGAIQAGQTVTGSLAAASERSVGCSGCFADFYRVTINSAQTLVVTLSSTAFDAYLRILDESQQTLSVDDDSGGGTDSRIVWSFTPGTYLLEATTYDVGESGGYSLSLGGTAAPEIHSISVGQTASGNLTVSSGRSVGCGGCFTDLYQFTLSSPQTLEVAMSSTAVDSYLRVLNSNLETVRSDDDSGGGTNARIAISLAAGAYFLEASTYDGGESGAYTLALLAVVAPPPLVPIEVGTAASGSITSLSGRATGCPECFANVHEFTVRSSEALVIALNSAAFDAFLRVLDSNGTVVASDDDSGGDTNSQILQNFAPGTYRVEVTSYYEGETGPYNLSIGPATATVNAIAIGQTVNGSLTAGSGRLVGCGGCYADLYEFSAGSAQTVLLTMSSTEFDTYVRVLGANGVTVAFDDDSAGGTDSRITYSFPAGRYRIEATSYSAGESGSYRLSLQSFVTGTLAPAPVITALSPSSASAGGAGFVLTVTGRGFVSGSVVRWNGSDRPTTFVSATELRATISTDNLSAGTPSVRVFSPLPGGGISNPLRFTVVPTATLSITPQYLNFRATENGGAPPNQTLSISNLGSGSLQWDAEVRTGSGNWLRISRVSGSTPNTLEVSADPAGLKADVYTGRVTVQAGTASPVSVIVTLLVTPSIPILRLSQAGFTFQGVEGRSIPSQSFQILNVGQGTLNWRARATTQDGLDWFSVESASGVAEGGPSGRSSSATIRVDSSRLRQGAYTGLLTLEAPGAPNSPLQVYVIANILAPSSDPVGDVRPAGLIFIGTAGSSPPAAQEVLLSSSGGKSLFYSVEAITEGNWLTVTPSAGELSAAGESIPIRVQPQSGLAANVYRGRLRITFSTGNTTEVAVSFLVTPPGTVAASYETARDGADSSSANPSPRVDCAPADLVMEEILYGGNNLSPQVSLGRTLQVQVVDYPCGQPVTGAVVTATFSNGDPLLILDHVSDGIYTKLWTPSNPEGTVLVTLQAQSAELRSTLALEGKVLAAGGAGGAGPRRSPQIFPRGVVNGASFAPGQPLSPGSIFSLFGRELSTSSTGVAAGSVPLPRDLGETRITIAGLRVPLFFSADGQVNGQVPFELTPGTTTQVVATAQSALAAPEQITMAAVQPGIFTVNSSGQGQGAILIANVGDTLAAPAGSIPGRATRPAVPGEFLTIYCTGLGSVTDPPPSGTPALSNPLSHTRAVPAVTVGGIPATVSFSGLAPGFVGLYQVNVEVPANAPADDAVPVVLTIGGVAANTVTVAIGR